MVVSFNSRLESNNAEEKNLRSLTEASAQLDGDGAPRIIDELQVDRTVRHGGSLREFSD